MFFIVLDFNQRSWFVHKIILSVIRLTGSIFNFLSPLNSDLVTINSDYVSRTTDNTVNSQITLTKSAGINSGSFGAAPLHIRADYANNPNTRAQIGFENSGFNAISLWLDVDGRLKMTDNSGTTKTLAILEDLS